MVIPENWAKKQLSDIVAMKSGETITSERIFDNAEYPCYGGNGLRGYTDKYTHEGEFALVGRQGALCGNVNYAN
ncbi:MAG: restriction endonuclease subunit S, partial [Selenomonas sp.]|nr:restriction endonuclease subunit S [Selenomonas sp.]